MPDSDIKQQGPRLTRREKLTGYKYPFDEPPEPDSHEYIIAWAYDAGMVMQTGQGPAPLNNQELVAFDQRKGLHLTAWESDMIMMVSRVYVSGLSRYTDKTQSPPYESAEIRQAKDEHRAMVEKLHEERERRRSEQKR